MKRLVLAILLSLVTSSCSVQIISPYTIQKVSRYMAFTYVEGSHFNLDKKCKIWGGEILRGAECWSPGVNVPTLGVIYLRIP